jgi:hypothetical protein
MRWSILLFCGLAACAVTSLEGQRMPVRSDTFAAYVEEVFRRQNEVVAELALALDRESPETERFVLLEEAELALLTECRGLNEMAREQRNGEQPGGLGALKRARQAPDCERATARAAALL